MADLTGQTLGQYKLEGRIGKGGMATVYRAYQPSMDRRVAVKVMAPELGDSAEFVARFEREARVIARLQHPHILPVFDFGRDAGQVYLVMRLVEGGVLSSRLERTTLSLVEINRFLQQIAAALAYAHQHGVIHRDLKPNNILLDELDNVYLTDFGIAKMLAGTTSGHSLTATGNVMGTPAYMAPEQWRSEQVDARTDIYSLGIILYQMLLGDLPFQSETPFGLMYKHFDQPPPPACVINPNLPDSVEAVLARALAKNPDDRYPAAGRLAEDFNQVVLALPPESAARRLPRATPDEIAQAAASAARASRLPQGDTTPAYAALGVPKPPPPRAHAPTTEPLPAPETQPTPRPRRRGMAVWIAAVGLLAIAALGLIYALSGGPPDGTGTPDLETERGTAQMSTRALGALIGTMNAGETRTLTPGETGAAVIPTTPAAATDTASPAPTATRTPTVTAVPSDTPTATPTRTPSRTPRPTRTPTVTQTASRTPTNTRTPTPSDTPDLEATTDHLLALRLTATAEAQTDTPIPTASRTPTDTRTPTVTQTASRTPTNTRTPTMTQTASRTPTDTRTPTVTQTASRTPTNTRTPTPSDTPDLEATTDHLLALRLTATAEARTDTPTPTLTRTPDLEATADYLVAQRLTATANAWTDTPTPDVPATILAGLTQTALAWTDTPTPSRTPSPPPTPTPFGMFIPTPTPRAAASACLLPVRVQANSGARTTLLPDSPTRIRSGPGLNSSAVLHSIPPGQTFWIDRGPECVDGINWWQVRAYDAAGLWTGWIAEGAPGQYWIEPFATGSFECVGALPPRLTPGEQGRITLFPALPSNVRTGPSRASSRLDRQLAPGQTLTVISGPVCDPIEPWRWWLVRTGTTQGWVAEGEPGEYWVEPWP